MIGAIMQHVIIVGFGPVGRVLGDALIKDDVPFTVIEVNAATVSSQRSLGRSVIHGDASDPAVLASAGIGDASAVVITMPDPTTALRICEVARSLAPTAVIAIRTRHLSQALQARQLGADITVVEEIETARAMATVVTAALEPGEQSLRESAEFGEHLESRARSTKSRSRPARDCSCHSTIAERRSMTPERQGAHSTCEPDGTRPNSSSLKPIMCGCAT
jgi:voltage-gated potassium channel Kch